MWKVAYGDQEKKKNVALNVCLFSYLPKTISLSMQYLQLYFK